MNVVQQAAVRFARLRIGTRLMLAFGAVLALTALIGAAAVFNLARVNQTSGELAGKFLPSVSSSTAARAAMLEMRDLELRHVHADDDGYRAEYEDKMKEVGARAAQQIAGYESHVAGDAERKLADTVQARWKEYQGFRAKVIELGRAGKTEDARDVGDGASKVALDETITALDLLTAHNVSGGQQAAAHAAKVYAQSRLWTLGLVAAALGVGVALALLIARSLLRQLGGEPALATEVVRAVAGGDLTTAIPVRAGDTHSLMAALRHMQASLAGVVSSVRGGSQRVAGASAEIAQGNSDLSSRTEQQASALEQTAASMEQLGATVRQNVEHAGRADTMARSASEVASQGGAAVTRVVETMRSIEQSSRRIADIIGTIDGIAFQTNILALNAAVEAARAGEQGRGFAVVAGEVRNLAKRSADAAREIKSLIAASVERVQQGTAQADEAGATMGKVVGAIASVTDIMREINAASREQSAGVQQVGQAVTQMDQSTQRNAALVEQSAAAAESLRQQAQELVEVVAAFRLAPA